MWVVAAIGTVICLKEVASEPLFRLLLQPTADFELFFSRLFSADVVDEFVVALTWSSSAAELIAASSSLKLTRLGDFALDDDGEGEVALVAMASIGLLLL